MTWVTFEVAGGGLVAVQRQHVVAIYDEQGVVKLSTTASGVHVLKVRWPPSAGQFGGFAKLGSGSCQV
jgi:hypothetical protein